MNNRFSKQRVRWIVLLLPAAIFVITAHLSYHLGKTAWHDRNELQPLPPGVADDASRLNATNVAEIWDMPADSERAEQELTQLLRRAAEQKLHVAIAGARHSMGGQTIYPAGIQINMLPYHKMELDEQTNILHVQAGARWADVAPYLDAHRRAPWIMQSNNSFTVGGSLSVNCHGWQHGRPPIASSVESLRVMTADGQIVRCSRSENSELFSLVLGGYGLFGVILDADLHVVTNECYVVQSHVIPADQFVTAWDQHVGTKAEVGMACGRLSVVPGDFLNEAILYVFTREGVEKTAPPALKEPGFAELSRTIFRGAADSDYGKKVRWRAERDLQPHLQDKIVSRNQLLNEPADLLANHSQASTDILHEYFVPRAKFADFVKKLRVIIPQHHGNLMNLTVRDVHQDPDSMLRYADVDMLALVMLYEQPRDQGGNVAMQEMTQELIDAALACGGRYYLPYRLHATPQQFARVYPQAERFFELKRQYDPDERFQNEFYRKYGKQAE